MQEAWVSKPTQHSAVQRQMQKAVLREESKWLLGASLLWHQCNITQSLDSTSQLCKLPHARLHHESCLPVLFDKECRHIGKRFVSAFISETFVFYTEIESSRNDSRNPIYRVWAECWGLPLPLLVRWILSWLLLWWNGGHEKKIILNPKRFHCSQVQCAEQAILLW